MNKVTAADIIAAHRRYGRSAPLGEWGAIQDGPRAGLLALLDAGDEAGLAAYLAQMFRTPAMAGLVTLDWRLVRDDTAALHRDMQTALKLWLQTSPNTSEDLRTLAAPTLYGEPFTVRVLDLDVMVDTPRHDYYARRVHELVQGGVVVEIGAGYGGFACQLLRAHPKQYRVVLVDLPETLYLAASWLARALPSHQLAWYSDDPDADIVLVPAQEMWQYAVRPQLVFSSHSLSEMAPGVAMDYVRWLGHSRAMWFYHDNAEQVGSATSPGPNGLDGTTCAAFPEVTNRNLVPDLNYREHLCGPLHWPNTGCRYREHLYERIL